MIEPIASSRPSAPARAASMLTSAPPEQLPARCTRSAPVIARTASIASSAPSAYVSSPQWLCSALRVAPGEREHLLALAHQVLDHAALGREVDEVVLVDHRRHDQQRLLAHRRRLGRVPDQLEQLGAQDDRAGRGRDVDADLERVAIDAGRQPRRRGHVAGEVAGAAYEVGAALLARRAQRNRVGQQVVGRREGIVHVLEREAHAPLVLLVEPGVGHAGRRASRRRRGSRAAAASRRGSCSTRRRRSGGRRAPAPRCRGRRRPARARSRGRPPA